MGKVLTITITGTEEEIFERVTDKIATEYAKYMLEHIKSEDKNSLSAKIIETSRNNQWATTILEELKKHISQKAQEQAEKIVQKFMSKFEEF